jgi:hypothetical protein
LPEPVLALPQTSRPASASAIVMAWIGNGSVMLRSVSAAMSASDKPSDANVVVIGPLELGWVVGSVLGGPPLHGGAADRRRNPVRVTREVPASALLAPFRVPPTFSCHAHTRRRLRRCRQRDRGDRGDAVPFLDLLTSYGSPWGCEERSG